MLRSHLSSSTYFSRRPRSRARQQRQTLPDWVWGIGLGLIVLGFVGAYFLLFAGGGSGATCDEPLAPLGRSDITAEAFEQEDADLGAILQQLSAGDLAGANAAFFGRPVHSFSHNVDPPLREKDEGLAKEVCRAVLGFEESLVTNSPADSALKAQQVRNLMRDAAQALGFPRPG